MSFFNNTPNSGGGLFGTANTNTNNSTGTNPAPATNAFGGGGFGAPSSGGLFGAGSNTSTSNAFGGNNASSTTPASGGLFGANAASSNTNAAPATSLFGGGTAASGTGQSLFGGGSSSTTTSGGGLFGTNNASNTPGQTASLFGNTASTTPANNAFGATKTATPSTGAGSLFGGASGFSLPKPGETSATAKPGGSSLFGQPAASNTTGSTGTTPAPAAAPATGSGLFGLPAKPPASTSTPAPAPTTAPGSLFGGGGLFGQANTSTTTQPAAPTTGPTGTAPGTGLFGKLPTPDSEKKDAEKKDAAPAATTGFGLFGKPVEKKEDTSSKETDKKDGTAPTPGAANASTAVSVPPPSMLRGKSLEDIISRWTSELEANVRDFNKFSAEVSVWDRALIENGNNIAALFSHVQAAERQQNSINEALEHIEQQQKDLGSTLDAYEKASQDILGGQSGSLRTLDTGPADNERDKNYTLATDLHTHLDDLSGSLTQMIDSVNGLSITSKPTDSPEDPMSQIAQILSSHLESLQWIDSAVREVESKATDVEKRIKDSGHLTGAGAKSRGFGSR